jgi:adenylosuccinate synthase
MIRHAARVNSLSDIAITKLDVLDDLDTLKVCVAYRVGGNEISTLPYHQSDIHEAEPVYEELPGWKTSLSDVREPGDLPAAARDYLSLVEEASGVPITLVGVGPGRRQYFEWS